MKNERIKGRIRYVRDILYKFIISQKEKPERRVYLLGTEDYGNLGDQQIAVSIIEYIRSICKYSIVEVTATEYYLKRKWLIKRVGKNDIIVMTGGGNFGNVYGSAQIMRRDIIRFWKRNPKIVMPTTIYYDNTEEGKRFLRTDKKVFSKKNRVIIIAREETSYKLARRYFNCESILAPDIVFSSSFPSKEKDAEKVSLCLRNDFESRIPADDKEKIKKALKAYFKKISIIDTQKEYMISQNNRQKELDLCFNEFQTSSLIVTDRLHGMIFSAITSTPCIVFGNYNHKVSESYKWVSTLNYIKFAETVNDFFELLETSFWKNDYVYDVNSMKKNFDEIGRIFLS